MRSIPFILVLVLVGILVLPGIVAADDSHPIWELNLSEVLTMSKVLGREIEGELITDAMNFCWDPGDGDTVVLMWSFSDLENEGTWNYTMNFNDGSTVSGTVVRRWVTGVLGIQLHETDTELNGEWLNITEILVNPEIQVSYGYNKFVGWKLYARSGFAFIDPMVGYPGGNPDKNPLIRFTFEGPGPGNFRIWKSTYDELKKTTGFVSDLTGETGWFGLISNLSTGIYDLILTVTGFLAYFTWADLPLVFFLVEGIMFLVSLDKGSDIFAAGERWISMNSKLIGGIVSLYEMIVSIINQAIGIFKP